MGLKLKKLQLEPDTPFDKIADVGSVLSDEDI